MTKKDIRYIMHELENYGLWMNVAGRTDDLMMELQCREKATEHKNNVIAFLSGEGFYYNIPGMEEEEG